MDSFLTPTLAVRALSNVPCWLPHPKNTQKKGARTELVKLLFALVRCNTAPVPEGGAKYILSHLMRQSTMRSLGQSTMNKLFNGTHLMFDVAMAL